MGALVVVFAIFTLTLWFWAILDINRTRFQERPMNIVLLLVVLVFPLLGPLIYFQLKRNFNTARKRRFNLGFDKLD